MPNINLNIRVTGNLNLENLIYEKLKAKEARIQSELLNETKALTQSNIKLQCNSTGRLASAWRITHTGWFCFMLVNSTPYGKYWLLGRGPVYPKKAKVLHYFVCGREVWSHASGPAAGHKGQFFSEIKMLVRSIYGR